MKKFILIISVLVVFIQTACTTDYNKIIKDSEQTFYKGNYKDAARMLIPNINEETNNQLLFMMECGLMLHCDGDYENSNKVFLQADKLADTIARSLSKEVAALLLNETKTNYRGEDFERVLINMYLGINYLMLNKPDEARVSFKKVNDLLRDINVTTGKQYKQNIMAKYLTAIAFEIIADMDNDAEDREFAYIEYKQINELDPQLELVRRDLQLLAKKLGDDEDYNMWKSKFGKTYTVPDNSGELIMFFQAGQGAVKVSRGSLLDDVNMKNSIRISAGNIPLKAGVTVAGILIALKIAEHPIPEFKKRSNRIDHLDIYINGKRIARTTMLENIEDTAVKNLQEDYNNIYGKVAAGIVVKAAAAVAAGLAAKELAEQSKKLGGVAGLIGAVVGVGTGSALASQIKPDLRCWHSLPGNLQISRIFLEPGKYNVVFKFIDQGGNEVSERKEEIEIKKGRKTFFNYRTLY